MEPYTYPIKITKDTNDTFLVSFPDFPEAHTFGDTKEDAVARAVDALATVIDAYIADRREIPAPSSGSPVVTLPALMVAKVALYQSMRRQRVGKAELGRRLRWHLPQVDRLLDVRHGSQLEQLEAAFGALGQRLEISIVDCNKTMKAGARTTGSTARGTRRVRRHGPRAITH